MRLILPAADHLPYALPWFWNCKAESPGTYVFYNYSDPLTVIQNCCCTHWQSAPGRKSSASVSVPVPAVPLSIPAHNPAAAFLLLPPHENTAHPSVPAEYILFPDAAAYCRKILFLLLPLFPDTVPVHPQKSKASGRVWQHSGTQIPENLRYPGRNRSDNFLPPVHFQILPPAPAVIPLPVPVGALPRFSFPCGTVPTDVFPLPWSVSVPLPAAPSSAPVPLPDKPRSRPACLPNAGCPDQRSGSNRSHLPTVQYGKEVPPSMQKYPRYRRVPQTVPAHLPDKHSHSPCQPDAAAVFPDPGYLLPSIGAKIPVKPPGAPDDPSAHQKSWWSLHFLLQRVSGKPESAPVSAHCHGYPTDRTKYPLPENTLPSVQSSGMPPAIPSLSAH